jgi:hypothetical protein
LVLVLDAIQRIDEVRAPRLVESREGFNIVTYKGKSWVVDQSAGSVDFRDQGQLQLLATTGKLFETGSIGEARAAADRMHIAEASIPKLVESRHGFNIVSYKGKSWVVDQSAGNVDFRDQEQLRRLADTGQLLETETIGEARVAIDRMLKAKVTLEPISKIGPLAN